jgi:NtrC-family two-component system sensor histidine kinase KinB
VEQLLLGSRAGAGQLQVTNGPFDVAGLLRGAAVAFRPMSELHTLVLDMPDDLPQAYGDSIATDIIVGQLLENAYKYSPEGGPVTIRARSTDDEVEVTVEDEGIGIRPQDRDRVFDRFVQAEAGDRRPFGGIGLGLYIVRQLARAQEGAVEVGDGPNGGTTMRLTLRRAAVPPLRPIPPLPKPRPASEPTSS